MQGPSASLLFSAVKMQFVMSCACVNAYLELLCQVPADRLSLSVWVCGKYDLSMRHTDTSCDAWVMVTAVPEKCQVGYVCVLHSYLVCGLDSVSYGLEPASKHTHIHTPIICVN